MSKIRNTGFFAGHSGHRENTQINRKKSSKKKNQNRTLHLDPQWAGE